MELAGDPRTLLGRRDLQVGLASALGLLGAVAQGLEVLGARTRELAGEPRRHHQQGGDRELADAEPAPVQVQGAEGGGPRQRGRGRR